MHSDWKPCSENAWNILETVKTPAQELQRLLFRARPTPFRSLVILSFQLSMPSSYQQGTESHWQVLLELMGTPGIVFDR